MKLDVLEETDRKIVFVIEGISIEMANAIRRIILTEIPSMAIDEVIILKNDSPLYDEILAHRLGMIPIKTDLSKYNLPGECECGGFGCPLCQVSFTCDITNTTNKELIVYSGDLNSNDPDIVPVNENIPIAKIDKNSKVILECYAILGRAKEHTKFSAVSNCFYRFYPIIELNESAIKNKEVKETIVNLCPKNLYALEGNTLKLKKDYWKTCNLCMACENNSEGNVKVDWKKETYIFSIETDGTHKFDVLLKNTFEVFLEKISEFSTKLEELEIES
ncbi:MAG: DNA-directed RNA polymerase subunit D [Candidatus Lokiarchaeota archaeon]|nr:DNA-directed RNA polymerase subunit D [Candidatus Lokiarchaeota archaeon]MBD3341305.1 DNA-directed RNA polymerase subunit D [Candidatus Lokiarchaeota archaeon]